MARPWTFADLPVPPTAWADLKDASTVTVDGSYAISAVRSKGTLGGSFVPPTAARAPTYVTAAPGNYPVAAYDPSRETTLILDVNLSNQPRTVVVAWISGGTRQGYEIVVDFSTSQGDRPIIFGSREDNRVYLYAGDNVPVPGSTAAGVMHVLIVEFAGASSRYYYNGTEVAGVNPGYFVPQSGVVMGGLSSGVLFSGQFAELAVIPGVHSGDEWDRITQGTMWKWGQQAKIASGATYKNAAPSISSGPTLSISPASITAATTSVQLLRGYRLPVSPVAFTATTNPVATRATRRLQVTAAALALATKAVAIVRGRRLAVDPAAFVLTTSPVQPRAGRQIAVTAASFLVTTRAVGLIYGTTIGIAGASIAVTAGAVDLRVRRLLRIAPAAIVATAGPVRVALQRRLRVAAASIAVTLAAVALRLASGFVPAPSAGRTITLVDRGSRTLVLGDQGSRRLII